MWLQWTIALVIVASVPFLIRWGRKHARGRMGGVAMMFGLAFGHLFDPAQAEATEALVRRRESGKQEAEAGESVPPHMLIITGTFRVPPANLEAARPAMAAMIAASRAEAGCLHYSYGEDVLDPGLIHVTEHWASREALAEHGIADHIKAWRAAWPELGIGERDLTLFDADKGVAI